MKTNKKYNKLVTQIDCLALLIDTYFSSHRTKQFITEEKMAAHFQDMHISSNYSHSAIPSTSGTSEPQPCCSTSTSNNCIDLDVDTNSGGVEDSKSIHPRLVISEELKRLQQEPMLPASLLSKL